LQPQNRSRKYPLNWVVSGAVVIAVIRTRLYMVMSALNQAIQVDYDVNITGVIRAVKMT
jgi:hypothetical protein